jgi:hypothetical protein
MEISIGMEIIGRPIGGIVKPGAERGLVKRGLVKGFELVG